METTANLVGKPSFPPVDWANLSFNGFNDLGRLPQWQAAAEQLLEVLRPGKNPGLVAETGTGKTIIIFLAALALGKRTIFLAPSKILVKQHYDLYLAITGLKDAIWLTGKNRPGQRQWRQYQEHHFVFATPQVFMADLKRQIVGPQDFGLLVIDEAHHASGNYPYAKIAEMFSQREDSIIALSASPGGDIDRIGSVTKNCRIDKWLGVEIFAPTKTLELVTIPLCKALKRAQEVFDGLRQEAIKEIKFVLGLDANQSDILPINNWTEKNLRQAEALNRQITGNLHYQGLSLLAYYRKLQHAHRILISESPVTFLAYYNELLNDQSKASQRLMENSVWHKMRCFFKDRPNWQHPKTIRLLEEIRYQAKLGLRGIVFANNKTTATALSEFLTARQIANATLFGGAGKSVKKQQAVLDKFRNKELQVLLVTSVVEEGISVPEVDYVIHYTLPNTDVARLQRDGRTGRFRAGKVVYLMMDCDSERGLYYAVFQKLKIMRKLIYRQNQEIGTLLQPAKPRRRRKKTDPIPDQLSLF